MVATAAVASLGLSLVGSDPSPEAGRSQRVPSGSDRSGGTPGPTSTASPPPATTSDPPAPVVRDAWLWPFASSSPFNMPRGQGATFDDREIAGHCGLNAASFGVSVGGAGYPFVPETGGNEFHASIIRPDGVTADEYYRYLRSGQRVSTVDLRGPGYSPTFWRVSDLSQLGGLIRTWDIAEGVIRHTLEIGLSQNLLATYAVWPTSGQHLDAFAPGNTGFVPYGALVAIPSNVPMPTGLTATGRMIWRALRDYGAYVAQAKNDYEGGCVMYAEAAADVAVNSARGDMAAIFSQVRLVTNSTPAAVGGPGPRLARLAPPL